MARTKNTRRSEYIATKDIPNEEEEMLRTSPAPSNDILNEEEEMLTTSPPPPLTKEEMLKDMANEEETTQPPPPPPSIGKSPQQMYKMHIELLQKQLGSFTNYASDSSSSSSMHDV